MNIELNCVYQTRPAQTSLRVGRVIDHFGLSRETERHVVAEGLVLDINEGDIVAFTGESGSGKSSLMKALARQLEGVL